VSEGKKWTPILGPSAYWSGSGSVVIDGADDEEAETEDRCATLGFRSAARQSVLLSLPRFGVYRPQRPASGRGRWLDNVFIERLGRSLKYEDVKGYADGREARAGIAS
jgi:hypothetical protein